MIRTTYRNFFQAIANRFSDIEETADAYRKSHPNIDRKLVGAVFIAAFGIIVVKYYGGRYKTKAFFEGLDFLFGNMAELHRAIFIEHPYGFIFKHGYWSCFVLIFYAFIPFLYLKFAKPRSSLSQIGLGISGAVQHWRIYVFLYLAILMPLLLVSQQEAFLRYYPMYKGAGKSINHFLLWELIYLPQFLAVEFLFRGFLLFPFAKRFGAMAILFPILPYCMIHFGKPIQETIGAIVAGLALGTIALCTRSIWLGVAIHMSVALTMDILALWHKGKFWFLSSN